MKRLIFLPIIIITIFSGCNGLDFNPDMQIDPTQPPIIINDPNIGRLVNQFDTFLTTTLPNITRTGEQIIDSPAGLLIPDSVTIPLRAGGEIALAISTVLYAWRKRFFKNKYIEENNKNNHA